MKVIKAKFDGKQIVLPDQVRGLPPGEVVLVFRSDAEDDLDSVSWQKAQESTFAGAWDDEEDSIYDSL